MKLIYLIYQVYQVSGVGYIEYIRYIRRTGHEPCFQAIALGGALVNCIMIFADLPRAGRIELSSVGLTARGTASVED